MMKRRTNCFITLAICIDYRCDNRRIWLSAHDGQVPTPTSQNLEVEQQIRFFGADQLINCLEDWNPQFLICRSIYQKRRILRSGVGDWQSVQDSFFFEFTDEQVLAERVNDRHFWNLGVFSYAMIPRCRPNSRIFFFIVASIVYGYLSAAVRSCNLSILFCLDSSWKSNSSISFVDFCFKCLGKRFTISSFFLSKLNSSPAQFVYAGNSPFPLFEVNFSSFALLNFRKSDSIIKRKSFWTWRRIVLFYLPLFQLFSFLTNRCG